MKQTRRFQNPVRKSSDTTLLIEAGDTAALILRGGSSKSVTLTAVSDGAKTLEWDLTADGIPRDEDVVAVAAAHQQSLSADTNSHDDSQDHLNNDPVYSGA